MQTQRHASWQPEEIECIRRVVDTIPGLVWSAGADGSAEFLNRRWLDYTGLAREQALEFGWKTVMHPDDLPILIDAFAKAYESRQPFAVESRIRRFDGVFRWFLMQGSPLCDSSGTLVQWYGTNTDIDDRKRAEQVLRTSEENLRQTLNSIPGLVCTMGSTGEIEFVNEQMTEYFGRDLQSVSEWTTNDLFHPDDLSRALEVWSHAVQTGQPSDVEQRLRRADGVYRWFQVRMLPLKDASGQIMRWNCLLTDIEERKQAFAEIKLLKDQLLRENVALREEVDRTSMFEEIIGNSRALGSVLSRVKKVAPTDSSVLIIGETGTGKELIARAIHKKSQRSQRAFISVNCSALAPSLILSELFGHEKGAFTGAVQRRLGRFELANGGTIFLDEVGELPSDTQAALLRVLQEREIERVGGKQPIHVDVRVIAATNRNLVTAMANGTMRPDLFYRLNVFPIELPPLRERKEDILVLLEYFVERFAQKAGKNFKGIDQRTLNALQSYNWPGNVRELQNVVERSVIVSSGDVFRVDESWLSSDASRSSAVVSPAFAEGDSNFERNIIENALRASRGRVSGPKGAAVRLNVPPSTLDGMIRRLKIQKEHFKLT